MKLQSSIKAMHCQLLVFKDSRPLYKPNSSQHLYKIKQVFHIFKKDLWSARSEESKSDHKTFIIIIVIYLFKLGLNEEDF